VNEASQIQSATLSAAAGHVQRVPRIIMQLYAEQIEVVGASWFLALWSNRSNWQPPPYQILREDHIESSTQRTEQVFAVVFGAFSKDRLGRAPQTTTKWLNTLLERSRSQ